MKKALCLSLLFVCLLAGVPGVQAAAQPVPGVSAFVTQSGDPAFVFIRFYISPDDPNQDTGDYTYNITLDAGAGWVDLGEVTDINDGIGSELLQFTGATFTGTFNVTANDGTGPVDSCTVTIDTSVQDDHDTCGDMDPDNTFAEYFCLDTQTSVSGFNYQRHLDVSGGEIVLDATFTSGLDRIAIGALNLGGDVEQIRLDTYMRFASDFLIGEARVFLSTVDVDVGSTAFGDGRTTGVFDEGFDFEFQENGNSIGLVIYRHIGGSRTQLFSDSSFLGSGANSNQGVILTIHPDSGSIYAQVGTSTTSILETSELGAFHSLWVMEGWDEPGSKSTWGGGTDFCLQTDQNNPATPGLGGTTGLEGFDGEGGFGGDPAFPGVSVDEDNPLGVSQTAFALILAALLIGGAALLGFAWSGGLGASVAGVLGAAVSAILNLIPYWFIVVVFLIAVVSVVLLRRSQ